MRLRALALLLLLFLPLDSAQAVEVALGVKGQTGYNSNVFFQSKDPTGDGTAQLGPTLALRDRTGQLTWKLRYEPSYEVFYTTRGIDSFFHVADGEVRWQPSATTQLYASDRFSVTPAFSSTSETSPSGLLAIAVPVLSNSPVTQNYGEVGAQHFLSPRWAVFGTISSSIVDYQSSLNADSGAATAQLYMKYGLIPTDRIGAGLSATRQTIDQVGGGTSGSNYYQLFGIWEHDFSPTWTMSLNAGPTLVQPDSPDLETTRVNAPLYARQVLTSDGRTLLAPTDGSSCVPFQGVLIAERCGVFPADAALTNAYDASFQLVNLAQTGTLMLVGPAPEDPTTSLTYFANLSITKRWRWFEMTGAYVRKATNTSGFNQSLVTDTLSLTTLWDPSPRWHLMVSGIVQRQQSSSDQVFLGTPVNSTQFYQRVDAPPFVFLVPWFTGAQAQGLQAFTFKSGLKVMSYGLSAQLDRKLTRNGYVYGRATWDKQTTQRTGISSVETARYVVTIGFRYEFEPIHFLN